MTDTRPTQPTSKSQSAEAGKNPQPKQSTTGKKGGLLFIIVLFAALIIFSRHETINTIKCTPEIIAKKPDIIMLGAWWCSYCYKAKEYFQHNNIHYCEYDMENTDKGKQLYRDYGGGLPVLLIGKYQLNGFQERQIETALSLIDK